MPTAPITLAFVHEGKAFLPELEGYRRYFGERGVHTRVLHPRKLKGNPVDIEWHMMGTHFRRSNPAAVVIHEYASPSVPPLAALKDWIKKRMNCRPDYRLFLNEATQREMNFRDAVPFGFRDMFINSLPAPFSDQNKTYDFVYAGTLDKSRKPEKWLNHFATGPMKDRQLLILSRDYALWKEKYREAKNIHFEGPVPPGGVGEWIRQARYGLAPTPLYKPYGFQTSTKILEYLAQGLPVVCSPTAWTLAYIKESGAEFFLLKEDLSNLTMDELERFRFKIPDISKWTIENQLNRSGILEFLNRRFGTTIFTAATPVSG